MSRRAYVPAVSFAFTANVLLSAFLGCLLLTGCVRFGFSAAPDGGGNSDAAAVEAGVTDAPRDTPSVPRDDAATHGDGALGDGPPADRVPPSAADGAPDFISFTDARVPATLGAMVGVGSTSADEAMALVVDAQGNTSVTGAFGGTVDFGGTQLTASAAADIFVASYDAAGALRWVRQISGTPGLSASLAVDSAGNLYVTGGVDGVMDCGGGPLPAWGGNDVFVASYTSAGAHRWSSSYGGTGYDTGRSISVDDQGRATVTGFFNDVANFAGTNVTTKGSGDVFLLRLAADGSLRWVKGLGGGGSDVGVAVHTASQGESIVTGYIGRGGDDPDFGGSTRTVIGSFDAFVAAYDDAGGLQWLRSFGGEGVYVDSANDVVRDGVGNVIVSGRYSGITDFGDGPVAATIPTKPFVLSYSGTGAFRWVRTFPEAGTAFIRAIAVGPDELVAVLGSFTASVDLGFGRLGSLGDRDVFLLYLDSGGQLLSQLTIGGPLRDDADGLAFDSNGVLWIAGLFEGDISYGSTTLSSSGSSDIFTIKLLP